MKTYELISDEASGTTLKVTEGEKAWWVSSENSPRWQEYLRYTAWVEAGNDPAEFWNQTI